MEESIYDRLEIAWTWILSCEKPPDLDSSLPGTKELPFHHYGCWNSSILNDEDLAQAIQLHLLTVSKDSYICAQDVVDFIATPRRTKKAPGSGKKQKSISVRTARQWLKTLNWWYGWKQNGMYVDGHERNDVKKYRKALADCWIHQYEPQIKVYDNDGKVIRLPQGFPLPEKYRGQAFKLILVTHDESMFYTNDRCKTKYHHPSQKLFQSQKGKDSQLWSQIFKQLHGEGSLMGMSSVFIFSCFESSDISDREAHIIFKAENREKAGSQAKIFWPK